MLWCSAPYSWNGSTLIYQKYIRPVFYDYQTELDGVAATAQRLASQGAEHGKTDNDFKLIIYEMTRIFSYSSKNCGGSFNKTQLKRTSFSSQLISSNFNCPTGLQSLKLIDDNIFTNASVLMNSVNTKLK